MSESFIHRLAGTAWRTAIEAKRQLWDSGFIRSRLEGRAVDRAGNPLPWLTYPAIEFLKDYMFHGMRVHEYGCGQSTLWFQRNGCQVSCAEHDAAWSNYVLRKSDPTRHPIQMTVHNKRESYAELPLKIHLVLIDGPWREACADAVACRVMRMDWAPYCAILDNSANEPEAFAILKGAYTETIRFVGLAPGYKTDETAVFLNPMS